jgi:hypothetical protein
MILIDDSSGINYELESSFTIIIMLKVEISIIKIYLIKFLITDQDPEIFVLNYGHVLQNVHHHLNENCK